MSEDEDFFGRHLDEQVAEGYDISFEEAILALLKSDVPLTSAELREGIAQDLAAYYRRERSSLTKRHADFEREEFNESLLSLYENTADAGLSSRDAYKRVAAELDDPFEPEDIETDPDALERNDRRESKLRRRLSRIRNPSKQ